MAQSLSGIIARDTYALGVVKRTQVAQNTHTGPRTLKVALGTTNRGKQGKGPATRNKAILGQARALPGAKTGQARAELCRYLAFCEETGGDRPYSKGVYPKSTLAPCKNCHTPRNPTSLHCNRCLFLKRFHNKGIPLITSQRTAFWSNPYV